MSRRKNKMRRRPASVPEPIEMITPPPASSSGTADDRCARGLLHARLAAAARTRAARLAADQMTGDATRAVGELLDQAAADAEQRLAAARAGAAQTANTARREADELLNAAREQADDLIARARGCAEQQTADAERELAQASAGAQRLRREAASDADRIRALAQDALDDAERELAAATESAQRLRQRADTEALQLLDRAREDGQTVTGKAEADAERITAAARRRAEEALEEARQTRARADEEALRTTTAAEHTAQQVLERAAEREQAAAESAAEAEQKRLSADDRWRRALSGTERRLARRRLRHDDRRQRREEAARMREASRLRKLERRATRPTLGSRLARAGAWSRTATRHQARRILVAGPILAPMAVAWWSQTTYARDAFGWWTVFALGFAAAWELSTAFTGWMYHQARRNGDSGWLYRVMTWVFASGAAAMNYAHHCAPGGRPTQAAVAFATMSVVGMILWELYALLLHRQYLREQGMLPRPRPRVGMVRWFRYPVQSWTAWSLMITDSSLTTLDTAWAAAGAQLWVRSTARTAQRADRSALRSGLALHRVVVPRVRSADHGPAAVPVVRTANRTGPERTRSARPVRGPDPKGPGSGPVKSGPLLRSGSGPAPDRTAEEDLAARPGPAAVRTGPPHGAPGERTGLPDRTVPPARSGPDRFPGPGGPRGPAPVRTVPGLPDRTPGSQPGPDRPVHHGGPVHPAPVPDRTGPPEDRLVLTATEQTAVDRLRARRTNLSKRNIAHAVRETGGSISSDRARLIAAALK
ncbi:hypothetical protein [Streptomyces sp. NPDC001889]